MTIQFISWLFGLHIELLACLLSVITLPCLANTKNSKTYQLKRFDSACLMNIIAPVINF